MLYEVITEAAGASATLAGMAMRDTPPEVLRGSAQLLEHGVAAGDLELAGGFDIELLDDAVIEQHREALHAHAHAARAEIQLEPERPGPDLV